MTKYYYIPEHREATDYDHNIGMDKGLLWERPEDRAKIVKAGWRLVDYPNPAPPGSVILTTEYVAKDAETVTKIVTWETSAEAEAKRIEGLAQAYGQQVGALAGLLSVFGLAMPITMEQAAPLVYYVLKGDPAQGVPAQPELNADSQMLVLTYKGLRDHMSDDDIYAVSQLIEVAE